MTTEAGSAEAVQAWRNRSLAYLHTMIYGDGVKPDGSYPEIDVYDLMGVRGDVVPPSAKDVANCDPELTVNSGSLYLTTSAPNRPGGLPWPQSMEKEVEGGREYTVDRVRRLLGLFAHRADEAFEPITRTINGMREPLRTVAILSVFGDGDIDGPPPDTVELAGRLGTSAETMEWLQGVVMDLLAAEVRVIFQ